MDDKYICTECAKEKGCTWPKNHVATCHEGICDYCQKLKALCCAGDWDWPDGKCHGMRD